MKRCSFPARVGFFAFIVFMMKRLFPICAPTWRVNNHVSRQVKSIIRANETTTNINIVWFVWKHTFWFLRLSWLLLVESYFLINEEATFRCAQEFIRKFIAIQWSLLLNMFPPGDGNIKKHAKIGTLTIDRNRGFRRFCEPLCEQ